MQQEEKIELARWLTHHLVNEFREHGMAVPSDVAQIAADPNATFEPLWLSFRALVNMRPALPTTCEFLVKQDLLLAAMIHDAGITTLAAAEPAPETERIRLWRGDITTLAVDAIVNAANSGMTGCWQPLHYCIDNAIHTFAGIQLRAEMAELMQAQGHEEPTAHARITSAYNLPAKHIVHTVGPIASGHPTDQHRHELAQCYTACLDLAEANGCLSIAFCCISTGIFGFPQEEAARIAVDTVRAWLANHPGSSIIVVFNVFGEADETIYRTSLNI